MPTVLRAILSALVIYIAFFHALAGVGLLGPDEPRYAAVGREMARSGDWITPWLWSVPWFEKPALQYWMTGVGTMLGLSPDLAPRLPVAVLGVLFLAAYYLLLKEELGEPASRYSTMILGTSAGWLAFSHIGVPDLPMTAFYAMAMLLGMRRYYAVSGIFLGFAILAKALVPIVLMAPLVWHARKRMWQLWPVAVSALLVAAPWYILCARQNGAEFLMELIVKHHFSRFWTPDLQHVRPLWWYLPVLLAGFFPWTPLMTMLRRPGANETLRTLWVWAMFGFLFFSISINKLPGYLLPVMPAIAALLGDAISRQPGWRAPAAAVAALLGFLPAVIPVLPEAIGSGSGKAIDDIRWWTAVLPSIGAFVVVWFVGRRFGRAATMTLLVALVTAGVLLIQTQAYATLDSEVSARSAFQGVKDRINDVCLDEPHRAFRYGMNYYAGKALPDCSDQDRPIRLKR